LEGQLVVVWALQAGRLEGLSAVVRTLKAFNPASCLNPILSKHLKAVTILLVSMSPLEGEHFGDVSIGSCPHQHKHVPRHYLYGRAR
jgi:hypothetical protein